MQRVLSFQMARGLGESSEFVTKRMCFSFLFSVGFLCLLCGFLLGRFAAERTIETRAEKKRLELAGNGLLSTEHLQYSLLDEIQRAFYNPDEISLGTLGRNADDIQSVTSFLANLSLFQSISFNKSSIIATVRGSREPDRFVVVTANAEGINIVLQVAKALNHVHVEYNWKCRRTLIFCLFYDDTDTCPRLLSEYMRRRIVAYLTIYGHDLRGGDYFAAPGSDVVQYFVLKSAETVNGMRHHNSFLLVDSNTAFNYKNIPLRLPLDIPHAIFSFAQGNLSRVDQYANNEITKSRHVQIAQVLGQTIWTLSESLALQWKSKYLNRTINEVLDNINSTEFSGLKDEFKTILARLSCSIDTIYENIGVVEDSNPLTIRRMNDLIMDVDRALLCFDSSESSRTDIIKLTNPIDKTSSINLVQLRNIVSCYRTATQLLENW